MLKRHGGDDGKEKGKGKAGQGKGRSAKGGQGQVIEGEAVFDGMRSTTGAREREASLVDAMLIF